MIQNLNQTVDHQPSSPPTASTRRPLQSRKQIRQENNIQEEVEEEEQVGDSDLHPTKRWKADGFFLPALTSQHALDEAALLPSSRPAVQWSEEPGSSPQDSSQSTGEQHLLWW